MSTVEKTDAETFLPKETVYRDRVAVVIPMYNERENIGRCLDSLLAQDYPQELIEIAVVNGMSTDGSRQVVEEYARRYSNIRIFDNPARLTPTSINVGIRNSHSDVVIILGSHTTVRPDFVRKNVEYLNEVDVPVVGGTQVNVGDTYMQQAIGLAMGSPFGITSAPYRYLRKPRFVDTVVYAAYRRWLFEQVGYFDESLPIAEDAEFNWRIRKAGHRIFFSPDIVSYYYPRKTLDRLAKQFFWYGVQRMNVVRKHPDAVKPLHVLPPVVLLTGSILTAASLFVGRVVPALWILAGAYAALNILASGAIARRAGWKYFPVLPVAFLTMHLAWASGAIVGFFYRKKPAGTAVPGQG
ncbi:MAG: glycosyltransferase family 2 protein [candidate division KSB1 bacterium]|nr:glycosyltransferase family 2 protein [candidate division KSB1 bacterium]